MVSYHGRQLPILFAQGYITAFVIAVGNSNTDAFYRFAVRHIPANNDQDDYQWLAPLEAYLARPIFSQPLDERQPLDYALIALFFRGMAGASDRHPQREKLIQRLSWNTGMFWWFERAPISKYLDNGTSLRILLTPSIEARLNPWKFGAPGITTTNVKSYQELAQIGVTAFIEEFQRQSGIPCTIQQRDTHITIEIETCPFCLRHSPDCRVFWGITLGLLQWLHGTHRPNPIPTTLQINETISTSHTIVLDVLETTRKGSTAE